MERAEELEGSAATPSTLVDHSETLLLDDLPPLEAHDEAPEAEKKEADGSTPGVDPADAAVDTVEQPLPQEIKKKVTFGEGMDEEHTYEQPWDGSYDYDYDDDYDTDGKSDEDDVDDKEKDGDEHSSSSSTLAEKAKALAAELDGVKEDNEYPLYSPTGDAITASPGGAESSSMQSPTAAKVKKAKWQKLKDMISSMKGKLSPRSSRSSGQKKQSQEKKRTSW